MTTHMVFVYGTLKSGEPNHHYLSDSFDEFCKFIGHGRTEKKYPLVIASKYNIPYLLDVVRPDAKFVVGEIYQIDENLLKKLDALENHPDYYVRRLENVQLLSNESRSVSCWIYFLKNFPTKLLENQDAFLEDYSSFGDHGLVYVPRSKREEKCRGLPILAINRVFCTMTRNDDHEKNLDALISFPDLMTKDQLIHQLKIRLVDEKFLVDKNKEELIEMAHKVFVPKPQRAIFANLDRDEKTNGVQPNSTTDRKRKLHDQNSDEQTDNRKIRKLIKWP